MMDSKNRGDTTTTRRVLDMLVEGKIDAARAEELLDALGSEVQRPIATARSRERGQTELGVDDLIKLAANGVDAKYVHAIGASGLASVTVEELVELAANDVAPAYVAELVSIGVPGLSVEQIVELAANDVSTRYVRELHDIKAELTVEEMVELAANDVAPDYVRALLPIGLMDLTAEQIVELSQNGIDPADAATALKKQK